MVVSFEYHSFQFWAEIQIVDLRYIALQPVKIIFYMNVFHSTEQLE